MKLGLPDGGSEPTTSTERRAYDLLTEGFGPGFNGTLTVVVDAPEPRSQRAGGSSANERRRRRCEEFPGVAAVSPAEPNEAGDLTIVARSPRPRARRPTRPRTS